MNEDGGGERERGAARRLRLVVDEAGPLAIVSDSESDGEEVELEDIEGGEIVGLDGVHPTGERERELELEEEEDLRLWQPVKASMLIIGLVVLGDILYCELGLCRLLGESQTQMVDPRSVSLPVTMDASSRGE